MMYRLRFLRKAMQERNLDLMLITNMKNVYYFSGFTGHYGYLLISHNKSILVTDFRYTQQAREEVSNFDVVDINDFNLKSSAVGTFKTGFEDFSMSYADYKKYSNVIVNLTPVGDMILKLRSIKDSTEINYIKTAMAITDDAFTHITQYMQAGMTEKEVALEIEYFMRKNGAESLAFDTIVTSGARGALPHGAPTDKKLEHGDLVVMDFGCTYKGYCSDMTRTVAIGDVSIEQMEVYGTVQSAQERVLEFIKEGSSCKHMHAVAFDMIELRYPNRFGHGLGHGVGLDIHENPILSPKSDYELVDGNIVTVEPGIYIPGLCGVRIEDLVLITKNGIENLTTSTKELLII